MEYIPVYEGDESGNTVVISPEKVQLLGVLSSPVERRVLTRTVRAVGTVQVDERGQYTLAPKFEGWIESSTSTRPVSRFAKASHLWRSTAPSWCRRSRSS